MLCQHGGAAGERLSGSKKSPSAAPESPPAADSGLSGEGDQEARVLEQFNLPAAFGE
jgi:hypothetical protein